MVKKVFITFVIIISISIISMPLYNLARGNRISLLANYYDELPIEIEKGSFNSLRIVDNFEALEKVTPTKITYTNKNGFDKTCNLLLLINKQSNLDYNNIVVSLNDKILYLSDINLEYDEEYYYFDLGSKEIKAYSQAEDYFRIWIKSDANNLEKDSSLKMNFIIK